MAKENIKITGTTSIFALYIILVSVLFILDSAIAKINLVGILSCPARSASNGIKAFNFKSILCYIKLFSHIIGTRDAMTFFINSPIILLLSKQPEDTAGHIVSAMMIITSSLVSGVLTATLSDTCIIGSSEIVFLLLTVHTILSFRKKHISLNLIILFILYIAFFMYVQKPFFKTSKTLMDFLQNCLPLFICCASGICGSLFIFFAQSAPHGKKTVSKTGQKAKKSKKSKDKASLTSAETVIAEQ